MLADRERVAIGNALRASASSLQRVEGRIGLELRAMAEPEIRHEATAEVARLEEVKRQQRRGKLDLERDLNKVRQRGRRAGQRADRGPDRHAWRAGSASSGWA